MTLRNTLQDSLAKNRAEEIGHDVWEHFVIPNFYNKLDLETAKKPRIIIGGRGCGKTMLLRYLSHESAFSLKRQDIPQNVLTHIGLYWRADTQFCNLMTKRSLPDEEWETAFNHFSALTISIEMLRSLKSITASAFPGFNDTDLALFDFKRLEAFDASLPKTFNDLQEHFETMLWQFVSWVGDVKKKSAPYFLPGRNFVLALISILKKQCPVLTDATFYVYFDEYENLTIYQKKIINTWLKHSEAPLIFNIAMKRNSFDTKETTGAESLSDIHDYRQHDLEEYLADDFPSFAAEIILLELAINGVIEPKVDINLLRDPSALSGRLKQEYREKVKAEAQSIFPDVSQSELARYVVADKTLNEKIKDNINKALKFNQSTLKLEDFYDDKYPEATIVVSALLYRKKNKPDEIKAQLDLLKTGMSNNFTGTTAWIHNNLIGCILQLYAPYSRACPFFAGFNTFCKLSRGNIRHLLELCRNSLAKAITINDALEIPVSPQKQAEAAKQTSTAFLGEIKSFGRYGEKLHNFVFRLGSLFDQAHRRLTQSETEQSHFSIRSGDALLTEQDITFLNEAVKYSVLFVDEDTKKKNAALLEAEEYVLNPIYTPYFHISYRKKRKLELSTNDVICLLRGTLDEFTTLMRRYEKEWKVDNEEQPITLFSFIEGGNNG